MNTQLKKGVLGLCVLSLLKHRDCYGYELVEAISEFISISEGTIYPLLRRFYTDGYVTTYLRESQSGPPRKYYQLTGSGRQYLAAMSDEWMSLVEGVGKLMQEKSHD